VSGEYISKAKATSFPFANDQYDHVHADPHFIAGCETYKEWLNSIPAADVVERKTASWIEDGYNAGHLVCSKCGSEKPIAVESGRLASFEIKYCYFCGAKMDGGQEDV